MITTVAGSGAAYYNGDGQATSAGVSPGKITVDASDNIYFFDTVANRIRMVTKSTGIIKSVAGDGTNSVDSWNNRDNPYLVSEQATKTQVDSCGGIVVDSSGIIFYTEKFRHRIRRVDTSTDRITTFLGENRKASYSGDDNVGVVTFNIPGSLAIDPSDNIYIADSYNYRIRMVTRSTGIITTVAGDGTQGFSGDGGPAISAHIDYITCITLDASGNIYFADSSNHIRMVMKSTGMITTVAGTGTRGYIRDEMPAISALIGVTSGIAVDAFGNIYIADFYNSCIRMVTKSTGIITTVGGNGQGYNGDGGPAKYSSLYSPADVAVGASGYIYIADEGNKRIRMVNPYVGRFPTPSPTEVPTARPPVPAL